MEMYHRYTAAEVDGQRGLWTVSTAEYIYEINDSGGEPITTFHWHPFSSQSGDAARWPHLHAYGTRDDVTLHKLHLPTERVSLESVIRLLIVDLDVIPRRADWQTLLDRQEQAFSEMRSWG